MVIDGWWIVGTCRCMVAHAYLSMLSVGRFKFVGDMRTVVGAVWEYVVRSMAFGLWWLTAFDGVV